MGTDSKIEWTDATWNPVTGCSKVSQGCKHCYAERMASRLKAMGVERYKNAFELTLQHDLVERPLEWKSPKLIFVNSMSDLFHEEIPIEFVRRVFDTMQKADWHIFQVLTKRAERLRRLAPDLCWPDNVWMGVSVENEQVLHRVDQLRDTSAHVKFLSCEPLIGPLPSLDLEGINWVIVGGESGPGARPMEEKWVLQIKSQCSAAGVPFFFKQWGGVRKDLTGRELQGMTFNEMPQAAHRHTSADQIFQAAAA